MCFVVWVAGPLGSASQSEVAHISNIPWDKVYVNRYWATLSLPLKTDIRVAEDELKR